MIGPGNVCVSGEARFHVWRITMIKRNPRQALRPAVDRLESRRLFATVVGLTSGDELVTFDSATPGTVSSPVEVTGLATSETLHGIDFRPATGQLFGLGSTGQLYTINRTTGAATAVGSTPLSITGAAFGVDFNPQVDRLRIVSEADQNVRAVPGTGALASADPNLAYSTTDANTGANPNVVAAAYSNNLASTGATTLYGIDSTLNTLVTQGTAAGVTPAVSPNTGELFTVGALGVDVGDVGGFDVAESDGVAYAAFVPSGGSSSTLYTVNLSTGAATAVAAVGNNLTLKGLTAVPVQRTLFLLASSGTAFARVDTGDLATNPTLTNITGLTSGQTLASIDFRPATGQLFGATAGGQVYTINPATGAATAVGTGFTPALGGNITDVDFNPTVDRIRVVTDTDVNARGNPDTGALVDSDTATDGLQLDTSLAYATTDAGTGTNPDVVAVGYTNSVQGATATTLYGLDAARDVLVSIGSVEGAGTTVSPNSGQLFSVGALGVDVASGGLDIADDGPAFALVNAVGGTGTDLYSVNTATGAATLIGKVGNGSQSFADIAVGNSVITVTPATQNVAENAGNATITVTRNGVADGPATVDYALVTPTGTGVTAATAGTDFGTAGTTTFSGSVSFADGETSKTITVPLINDSDDEPNETLIVGLTSATGAGLGSTVQATVVITDDDADGGAQPGTVTVATDPVRTTGKATQLLTVVGTGGDDVIVVAQSGPNVVVTLNGAALGNATPVRGLYRIAVFGGAGDDQIRLNSRLKFSGELHGEAGDDLLVGSKGRDLLVGGDGTDALYGRGGDDILIGGISDFTAAPTGSAALMNVFLAKGSFASRANAVSTGSGVNNFVFSSDTIDDDDNTDFLAGEGKTDLYLTKANDIVVDESIGGGVVRNV
jgi:hypothetical protein